MSLTYGFYDSLNGDRRYNAEQMSMIFDGIINDGVFSNVGNMMTVTAVGGMYVAVGTGRAWFDGTWTYIDTEYPLLVEPAPIVNSRIDAVVLETNKSQEVRANSLKIVKGTIAGSPVPPTLEHTDEVNQYPLAYITIKKGDTAISQSMIENAIGTDVCPLVTGILKTASITNLIKQWNGEFDDWMVVNNAEFSTWFNDFEDTLSGDQAASLLLRIKALEKVDELMRSVTEVTLAMEDWTYTAPYIQSFAITDLTSKDRPTIEALVDGIQDSVVEDYLEQAGYVTKFISGKKVSDGKMVDADNYITAYCATDRPTIDLTFGVKGR